MQDNGNDVFIALFAAACRRCFGTDGDAVLSETEAKHLSHDIFAETGLVIGAKSLRNYSVYTARENGKQAKPSVATLDTLARYVLGAPPTDEITRKKNESHHPYWHRYKASVQQPSTPSHPLRVSAPPKSQLAKGLVPGLLVTVAVLATLALVLWRPTAGPAGKGFVDSFASLQPEALQQRGWFLQREDSAWWARRGELEPGLTLFTLPGDSWTDAAHRPGIKNLLVRRLPGECFVTAVRLEGFFPAQRWQQAGLLLLEDTTFAGKSLRLSLAYNDFFGGYPKPREVIVQAIYSNGKEPANPEELVHLPVQTVPEGQDSLAAANLQFAGLQIERTGTRFRFLYAAGPLANVAFKEALEKTLEFRPRFIGLFALKGFAQPSAVRPARMTYFSLDNLSCPE